MFLDGLEDRRPLFNPESNTRRLIKVQMQTLLKYRNAYWKQRFTVNRIKYGDECTKFFHSMATISHRRNAISQIQNEQGAWIQDHEGKAGLLWNSFKNRMGVSTSISMHFDLNSLIHHRDFLQDLSDPIQISEIDATVKQMPNDKAPGPDGFNGLFLKKCCPIIRDDFYHFIDCFSEGQANLDCKNSSFITLIPKNQNPETVNDYRPISLMNISPKTICKILADRLQRVVTLLIP